MKVEDANALRFIMQDEIYLLNNDKNQYSLSVSPLTVVETQQRVFNYLGLNKKKILVLVSYDDHEFIKDEHLTALESVLGRMGYAREDVAIFNIANHKQADHEQLLAYFEPTTIVILGKNSLPAGIKEAKFNVIEKTGDISILYTYSFDEMMTDVGNKKAFWDQIKNL